MKASLSKKTKFIFITGRVLSSLGKGLSAASIGSLLESRGLTVTFQKLDPYINVDPGTMNPFQHGEVYVTNDGAETDLDMGHYERYTNAVMGQKNNYTSGRIYYSVIMKERRGEYLGGTVQVIPHITDEIKEAVVQLDGCADVAIIEIGGTVGDIEGLPFIEAIRQLRTDLGREYTLFIHLTLVPYIRTAGEVKTKPTQHSVKELLASGIQPDILMCRTEAPLSDDLKKKIALFCNVDANAVISAVDVESIYELPLRLRQEGVDDRILEKLGIWTGAPNIEPWERLVRRIKNPKGLVTIGITGKYVDLKESYKSLHEALIHGGIANETRVALQYISADGLEEGTDLEMLDNCDAILVPGGFGSRGMEGKIQAVTYARERRIPFFGICLGMQLAVVEFAHNIAGIEGAHSVEFSPATPHPVIYLMTEWFDFRTGRIEKRDQNSDMGGTLRLGAYPCALKSGTVAAAAYGQETISERHRHRYEFNNSYRQQLEEAGLIVSGTSPDGNLVEIIELADHPWFLGCQFHPEFQSKPMQPHPLFRDFIKAAIAHKKAAGGEMVKTVAIQPTPAGPIAVGPGAPLLLIAGPCVLESGDLAWEIAREMKAIAARLGVSYVFKASFDKANRTSLDSFRGPGAEKGLRILGRLREEVGVPVVSDIHEPAQAEMAADCLDILQIPAFLCRQTDLLIAAARTGKVVNVKKGQFVSPWDMAHAVNKLRGAGSERILLTERGASFGYNNLVVDMRSLPVMRSFGFPVIYDATHSVQLPGGAGGSSGGQREFIPPLARAAMAVGIDGLFIEVHPEPDKALCDGPNSLPLAEVEPLLRQLLAVRQAVAGVIDG